VEDTLWREKFVPYVGAHAERVVFFMLTTFDRFLVVPIFAEMRLAIQDPSAYLDAETRRAAIASASFFDLRDAAGEGAFATWYRWHLLPEVLSPPRVNQQSPTSAPLATLTRWKASRAILQTLSWERDRSAHRVNY
jgi:hypothetical protein